jgi:hypothetical protein
VVATGIISEAERLRAAATSAHQATELARPQAASASPVPVFRFQSSGQRSPTAVPPPVATPVVPRPSARATGETAPPQAAPAATAETAKPSALRDMFRGFGLSRQPAASAPLRPGRPSEAGEQRDRPELIAERDELGEIPAFLRREREPA